MPIYEYVHTNAGTCQEPVEVFQHMSDDALLTCPDCGKAVYKIISTVRFTMKNPAFNEGEAFRNQYSHKLGRKVEKQEQFYEVPNQPGGGGGEIVNVTGLTPRQKEEVITEAHVRAGDERITVLGDKVEVTD